MPTPHIEAQKGEIADKIFKEIRERLHFLVSVGLNYLSLARSAETLSGGEAQRIRLASQIGAGLMGVMYVLDEPSIGLHQRDNDRLLQTLIRLRDLGNTVLVVEHDEDAIRAADHIIDIGPGAGIHGGAIIAEGTYDELASHADSLTGQYLSGKLKIEVPKQRTQSPRPNEVIKLSGASGHNLQNVDLTIPLGIMTCVTGVSGSGKSTLINRTLLPLAATQLNGATTLTAEKFDSIDGLQHLDKVVDIDQSPIGRTPRSNPATYTGVFDQIRDLFASTADAKSKGVYQSFVMDEVFGKMEGGNAAIAMYYAGDYLTMLDNNPDLKFVVPKEGSNWFVDAMCILKSSQHMSEAEEWINFIASTESNLANMDYIGYASPNLEALEGYPAYYEETYGEPLDEERYEIMAAPDDVLARCELYTNLPSDTLTLYNDLWTELGI